MVTFTKPMAARRFDGIIHARLLEAAKSAGNTAQAWPYLEAAHIVGQLHLKPHWQTHWHMLGLAWRTRDWPEWIGQMLRLALVPLGHLSGRLPMGNPGRSTVSAFAPMAVRAELVELIASLRSAPSGSFPPPAEGSTS
jgi:Protein of unknown function (DUF3703)